MLREHGLRERRPGAEGGSHVAALYTAQARSQLQDCASVALGNDKALTHAWLVNLHVCRARSCDRLGSPVLLRFLFYCLIFSFLDK